MIKESEGNRLSIKKQKTYLLSEIDKALTKAPDTRELKYFHLSTEKQARLDMLQRMDRHGSDGLTPEEEIEMWSLSKERWDGTLDFIDMKSKDQSGQYVTFELPNGGKFRIINTKTALQDFKKRVRKKYPVSLAKPREKGYAFPKPSAGRKEIIGDLVKIKQKGWFSDGHVLIKGEPPKNVKRSAIPSKEGGYDINDVIPKETEPIELQYFAFQDPHVGEAISDTPIADVVSNYFSSPPVAIFEYQGYKTGCNQYLFNAIRNRYPNAKFEIKKGDPEGPLVAKDEGEVVAMLTSIRCAGDTAAELVTMCSLEDINLSLF